MQYKKSFGNGKKKAFGNAKVIFGNAKQQKKYLQEKGMMCKNKSASYKKYL